MSASIRRQNLVVNARAGRRIAHREDHLAALEEVARHPVGRAEIDFVVAAVGEVEDARVLQEAADDGAHADAFRQAFDAGPQDAEAANDQVDLDSRLRGLVERLDDRGLEQGVHLGDDVRGAAGLRVLLSRGG